MGILVKGEITITKFNLLTKFGLIFFIKNFLIFKDLLLESEIIFILFILNMVPSARLELALPNGQGF